MAIKRVKVDELRTGMYIQDLNCGWLQHGFLRQQFLLRSPSQIQKMKVQGLHEVYIDTSLGEDVPEAPTQAQIEQTCLLYTSPSPRDGLLSRMPSSA